MSITKSRTYLNASNKLQQKHIILTSVKIILTSQIVSSGRQLVVSVANKTIKLYQL